MSATAERATPAAAWTAALAALLLGATLGEGGAVPDALLAIHGATVAMWIVVLARGRPVGLPAAPIGTALGAFVAVAGVSAARAAYGYAAFLSLQELAVFVAVTVLAATVGPDLPRRLAPVLLVGAAAHAVWAVGARAIAGVSRPASTFLNPNHLGAWIVAASLVAWGAPARTRRGAIVRAALTVLAGAGVAVTASRGAALGAAVGGAVLMAGSWGRLSPARRRAVVAVAVVGAVGVCGVLVVRAREADAFAFHRVGIWKAAVETASERPGLGIGPGQFPWASRAHWFDDGEAPMRFDRRFDNTHSDWLRPAVETGLAGTLVLLVVVGATVSRAFRRARGGALAAGEIGALAALAALAAQAAVENLSDRPALALLAAVLFGSCAAAGGPRVVPGAPAVRRLAIALLATAFALGDVATWLAWRAERAAERAADPATRIARLEEAVRRNPALPYPRARIADTLATSGPLDPQRYAVAREAAEAAVRRHPGDSELRRSLARLEATACLGPFPDRATLGRALAAYGEAERLAPRDATVPFEVADLLARLGMAEEAARTVRRAIELEPEAVAPVVLLAEIALDPRAGIDPRQTYGRALALAARHAGRSWDNAYTRTLMRVDPARVERIRAALERPATPAED